jgi:ribulose-phosphate 3-epimerase
MAKLAPSILSADFINLEKQIKALEDNGVEYLHIDVMDGKFVPNITIGPLVVKALRENTDMILDVHLMIDDPAAFIDQFAEAGADIITVHAEASNHLHRVVQQIKDKGIKAGVSINPATPVYYLEEIIDYVDLILLMSVNPGFGGQEFIESTIGKIKYLSSNIQQLGLDVDIEVDGGIKDYNVDQVIDAGADIIVAGSAIFNDNPIADNIQRFIEAMEA